jgi:cellulose biosynthesis protein BcsQ
MNMIIGSDEATVAGIMHRGQPVPIVAFYSIQGGVGKSTLARKYAELVTVAPGIGGARPNVLLIDLDIEGQGIFFRLTQGARYGTRTVHEMLAQRNVANAQAMDVTMAVSLSSGAGQSRGRLYLVPAAPPDAKGIFDTLAGIDPGELLSLLKDMIRGLVMQYDISCVVIDCAPGAMPYSAAAAALADVPLLIARNEQASYEQLRTLPEKFREWYPDFHASSQRVVVNAVKVAELLKARTETYGILDYVPFVDDVILEVEGLSRTGSFRMLLFEKYIVDIIKQVFVGRNHLIPDLPAVVGQEWLDTLAKLDRCQEAPSMRRLHMIGYLRWVGIGLAVLGVALFASHRLVDSLPASLSDVGMGSIVAGLVLLGIGWYAENQRHSTISAADDLVRGGPDEILKGLGDLGRRKELDRLRKLAESVPAVSEKRR